MKKIKIIFAAFFLSAGAALLLFYSLPLPGQGTVLMYHFIGSDADAAQSGNFVTLKTFEKQMHFLKQAGYRVIAMDDFAAVREGKRKPRAREIVLTFDDGNPSVFRDAWPVMQKLGLPSTHFLTSQGVATGGYGSLPFSDLQPFLKEPLLTWGAHSRTHPYFSSLNETELQTEILGSKSELEQQLGMPVRYFAYPFGDFDARALNLAKQADFRLAFTTSPKKLKDLGRGPFAWTRVKISESDSNLLIYWFKVSGLYEAFKLRRHQSKISGARNTV